MRKLQSTVRSALSLRNDHHALQGSAALIKTCFPLSMPTLSCTAAVQCSALAVPDGTASSCCQRETSSANSVNLKIHSFSAFLILRWEILSTHGQLHLAVGLQAEGRTQHL